MVTLLIVTNGFPVLSRATQFPPPIPKSRSERIERVRSRVEVIRANIAKESLEAVVRNLGNQEDYFVPGYQTEVGGAQIDFQQILSSRRTHKLVAMLSELSRDDARIKAKSICDLMYESHRSNVEQMVKHHEDADVPKSQKSLFGSKLGLGAAIFALAHFSEPSRITAELRRMEDLAKPTVDRLKHVRNPLPDGFPVSIGKNLVLLDLCCQVNLLVYSVDHAVPMNLALKTSVNEALADVPKRKLPLAKWDAALTGYDILRWEMGVPLDPRDVKERIDFYDWSVSWTFDTATQRATVFKLMELCGMARS